MPDESGDSDELVEPDPDDMSEPPGDMDERISLWPLSLEAVVRALHRTPPVKGHAEPEDEP